MATTPAGKGVIGKAFLAALVGVALTLLTLVRTNTPASGLEPSRQGWWQTANLLPPPPDVPAAGLYVNGGLRSPQALSAVRYDIPAEQRVGLLTLTTPGSPLPNLALKACPIDTSDVNFPPTSNGDIAKAPRYNCTLASVNGTVDAAKRTVTFQLGPLVTTNTASLAVMIVPVGPSDRATFQRPGPSSLATTTVPTTPPPLVTPPAVPIPAAPVSPAIPTAAPTSAVALAPAADVSSPAPVLATTPIAATPQPSLSAPRTPRASPMLGRAATSKSGHLGSKVAIGIVLLGLLGFVALPGTGARTKQTWVDDVRVRKAFNYAAAALFFYFIQQWFWPAPAGVLVQGMLIGGLTALVAFGITLIYRANRVINFAQGDLGGVPASLAVLLIVSQGWPYPLAVAAGIASAIVLGAAVEIVIIRRFFKAPRLILTVVTIGMATGLTAGELALPSVFHVKTPPQNLPSPFHLSFTIRPIVFHGNDILAMFTVPLAVIALVWFFRYTNIGIAVRASAESADRASLLGVPVKRVNTVVWVVATVLATVALIMQAGVIGLPIGSALGLTILLRALAAAVIGRMERLTTIFVAAMGLGVIQQAVTWHTGKGLLVDPIVFAVIIVALLAQRGGAISRLEDAARSSWQAVREIRPIPRELAGLSEVTWARRAITTVLAAVALALPPLLGEGRTVLAGALLIYGIVAVSLVLLTGWAGQVSLGQFAFAGVGAATGGWMTLHLHWDLSIVLVCSGLVGAGVAVLIGLPGLRIRGLFLAVATLGFALATNSYLLNGDFMHWVPNGSVRIPRPMIFGRISVESETRYYYLCLAAFVLTAYAVRGVRRSRTGRVLIGVRENERAVQAFGVNLVRTKLTAFALSGFLAAFAGSLLVHQQQNFLRNTYRPEQSLAVFVMVVIGGLASVPGAFLGAVFIQSLTWFSFLYPAAFRPALPLLGGGVGLIVILMFLPGGLGSLLYDGRDRLLRWLAKRRGIVVPSLLADIRTDDRPAHTSEVGEMVTPGPADLAASASARGGER